MIFLFCVPKNVNPVIIYSPSCRFKPVRFCSSFLMKSESFLSLHWPLCNYYFDVSKSS